MIEKPATTEKKQMPNLIRSLFDRLEVPATPAAVAIGGRWQAGGGAEIEVRSPIDGSPLASFPAATIAPILARWSMRPPMHLPAGGRCPPRGAASWSAAWARSSAATRPTWPRS